MNGLLYRSVKLYELLMLLLYGNELNEIVELIKLFVRPGFSVLELCCGNGWLAGLIECKSYKGFDCCEVFVLSALRKGLNVECVNVEELPCFPESDVVVMLNSLYEFNNPELVVERMIESANKLVIISEPVCNVVHGSNWLAKFFGFLLEGRQVVDNKFDEKKLRNFFKKHGFQYIVKTGRNLTGIMVLAGLIG